ncbi:hypothetical protein BDN71DRAFT_1400269, partial [Pleurotus eryngii]
ATVASWGQKYYGSACTALWKYICYNFRPNPETPLTNELDNTPTDSFYAHYAVLFQSSGTGKSRLVDELAKKIFLIPICLRDVSTGTRYPPADVDVRTYLTDRNTRIATYARCWAFMQALFRHTATVLKQDEFETLDYSETVALFRVKMTESMKKVHNVYCQNFFREIVRNAEIHLSDITSEVWAEDAQNVEPKEQDAQSVDSKLLQSLMEAWKELDKVLKGRINSSQDTKAPRLLICFDEAHELTVVHKATEIDPHPWSTFAELRATLRALINCSIFSIFLSTTGRFSQFAPLSRDDMSARVYTHTLKLIPPFCDTGMDLLAINEDKKVNLLGGYRLQDVVTDQFMTSFGRPLFGLMYRRGDQSVRDGLLQFAMQKLTNHHAGVPVEIDMEQATACLGFRLPFEFLSTTDISQDMEFKQVEGHLRICLKPHSESESMVTISLSEPFVSEAAAALLRTTKWKGGNEKVESIQVLKNLMTGFSIHAGDCGEFVALLLLTLARDRAANPRTFLFSDFMRHLLATRKSQGRSLSTMTQEFPKAMMHFNHFIRPHQQKIIHRDMLLLLMARGAGVLCAPNTRKIDIILPFLVDGDTIKPTNVGAILCQVKNDKSYTDTPEPELFKDMNPYKIGFLPARAPAVPLIKVFMALASVKSVVDIVRHEPTGTYNAVVYDIWIAGLSPDVYALITEANQSIWAATLAATRTWESIYSVPQQAPEMRAVRQTSHAGTANSVNHWSWANIEDIRGCLEIAKGAALAGADNVDDDADASKGDEGQRQSKGLRAPKRTKRS